jgi:hypothetical protein
MRSFQQVVLAFFALLVCALAQSSEPEYESTVYITSTVYRVNTVTMSSSPASSIVLANSTTTISATHAPTGPAYPIVSSGTANGTDVVLPTGSAPTVPKPSASPSQFVGAASALNVNAYLAALAAGVAYLVL